MTAHRESVEHTFLFADLAGFTALTEAHGDQAGAQIAADFANAVRALLPAERAELVKTIGDEMMVRTASTEDALDVGRRIVEKLAVHGSPPVRVGVHRGVAVGVEGDWFGASVNLASRVSHAARPGEVLLTEAACADLRPEDCDALNPRGQRYFKGVREPVSLFTAARVGGPGHELEVDPVCRMAVDPSRGDEAQQHRGRDYHFCSEHCASAFARDPRRFVAQGSGARAARAMFRTHLRIFIIVQSALVALWAVGLALGETSFPWFAFVLAGWGVPMALHYRAVRRVL